MEKTVSVVLVEIMNACGNIRACCDGAQRGCHSTQQLSGSVHLDRKKKKIPTEKRSAGRSTAHYRGAPCWNDTINSIFQIQSGHPALGHSEDYTGDFACFTADFQKCARVCRVFDVFRHSRQPLVSIHFTEIWGLKLAWDNKVIYHWEHNGTFMKVTVHFHGRLLQSSVT